MDINNLWSGYDLNSKKQNSRCLAVNTILEGKYLVGPVLGQGGFGITYVGYDLNMESKIAIKEYFPVELVSRDTTTMHGDRVLSLSGEKSVTYKAGLKKYVAEAQNVSQFSEVPGVVSVKDFFYANETAYIVMEFIDGISLKDYLKEKGGRLTEEESLRIMKPILEALVQVHKSGIIHRDISPDNIMLTFEGSGHNKIQSVKLIDFGAARMTAKNDQKSLTIILKHGYAPEEQYRTHGEQGPWTDVYALCAVLYRMLTGETPVPAMDRMFQDELKTFDKFNAKVSANTSAAILKGLAVKKDDRIQSVSELIRFLYDGAKVSGKNTHKGNQTKIAAAAIAAVVVAGVAGAAILSGKETGSGAMQETLAGAAATSEQASVGGHSSLADASASALETVAVEMEEQKEEKEAIVEYSTVTATANSDVHAVFLLEDGSIVSFGKNTYGQRNLEEWEDIAAVTAGNTFTAGLHKDGTVEVAGELYGEDEVTRWENIVAIEATDDKLYGLTIEGTLVVNEADDTNRECLEWTEIKDIAAWEDLVLGLTEEGTIVRNHVEGKTPIEISEWNEVEYIACNDSFVVGLDRDGVVSESGLWEELETNQLSLSGGKANSLSQINFFRSGEWYSYDAVRNDGKLENYNEYTFMEMGWEGVDPSEIVGIARIYDGDCTVAVKEDGTIVKYARENGSVLKSDLKDLRSIDVLNGYVCDAPILLGITKDNRAVYSALGDPDYYEDAMVLRNLSELIDNHAVISSIETAKRKPLAAAEVKEYYSVLANEQDLYENEENIYSSEVIAEQKGEKIRSFVLRDEQGTLYTNIYGFGVASIDTDLKQVDILSSEDEFYSYIIGLGEDGKIRFYSSEDAMQKYMEDFLRGIIGDKDYVAAGVDDAMMIFSMIFGKEQAEALLNRFQFLYQVPDTLRQAESWDAITAIAACDSRSLGTGCLVGLKEDGTVAVVTEDGSAAEAFAEWKDIASLHEGTYAIGAIKKDGTAVFLEDSSEHNVGQYNTTSWTELTDLAIGTYHTAGLKADGTVYAVGRNNDGQCDVEEWTDIVSISVSDSCTLGITSDGSLKIAGEVGW